MECIPFACPSCGARMYFVQETKATTYDILMFMIVDAAVILILMCRNIVNVAIQIAQLL